MDELLKMFGQLLLPMVKAKLDENGAAELILHWLGPKENDKKTAELMDKSIKGGIVLEAIDGPAASFAVKKVRAWAEDKIKE